MLLTTRVHGRGISWVISMKQSKGLENEDGSKAIQHLKTKNREKGSGAGRGEVKQEKVLLNTRKQRLQGEKSHCIK